MQLKKQILEIIELAPSDSPQDFVDRAAEKGLEISLADAEAIGSVASDVAGTYAVIRDIDTNGFEPAAIFVPTPSEREAN